MTKRKCPTCGGGVRPPHEEADSFPFCSTRCRTIDLGKWIDERYRIEGEPVSDTAWPGQLGQWREE